MHRNNTNIFIGTQKSAYRDLPVGKLKTRLVRVMLPLQQGFDGDCQTSLPVAIDNLPTLFALEQGIVGRMPLPNSTAVGTPFASVPAINLVQMNIMVKASLLKDASEFGKWNAHYVFVEASSFRLESRKLFYGNISIKPFGDFNYLPYNFPEVGLDIIKFSVFCSGKLLCSTKTLQSGTPSHELFSSCPDMPAKISLIKNFAFWGNNGYCEVFGVDVNSEDVLSLWNFFVLGKIGDNLAVWKQAIGLASPARVQKGGISLEVPVLFNGNRNPLSRSNTKINKRFGLCGENFAVAGNIKLDTDGFDIVSFPAPSITDKGTDDLNVERGVFLAN